MKVGVRLSQKVLLEHAVFRSIKTHYTFKSEQVKQATAICSPSDFGP